MQGGAAKGLALTAYTLIAFLENEVSAIHFNLTALKEIIVYCGNMSFTSNTQNKNCIFYVA